MGAGRAGMEAGSNLHTWLTAAKAQAIRVWCSACDVNRSRELTEQDTLPRFSAFRQYPTAHGERRCRPLLGFSCAHGLAVREVRE
jgi:hypothetical protein